MSLKDCADMADATYRVPNLDNKPIGGYKLITQESSWSTGFAGTAYYNQQNGSLVVGFAGTASPADLAEDAKLTLTGSTTQHLLANNFTERTIKALEAEGKPVKQLSFVGHSLGGALAMMFKTNTLAAAR